MTALLHHLSLYIGAEDLRRPVDILVRGRVLDAETGAGIPRALVIAVDARFDDVARSPALETDDQGAYRLLVTVSRGRGGSGPVPWAVELRIYAPGYRPYPDRRGATRIPLTTLLEGPLRIRRPFNVSLARR